MISKEKILDYARILKKGGSLENPKLELKEKWWDFSDELGIYEFIKDTTALANTYGGNGYIIIGISEGNGDLHDAPYPTHNKYDDPTKLKDSIYRYVQEPFQIEFQDYEIEGKIVVVLEIQESFNRPHVIKNHKTGKYQYQNFIPIRKTSGVRPADKFDLDIMYSTRNISIPSYKLDLYVENETRMFWQDYKQKRGFCINVTMINTGERTNFVTSGELIITSNEVTFSNFEMKQWRVKSQGNWFSLEEQEYIILQPNEVKNVSIGFVIEKDFAKFEQLKKDNFKDMHFHLNIKDMKHTISSCDFEIASTMF